MPITDERTNEIRYIPTMDSFSAIRNQALIHTTMWMNFENILTERSHSKNPYIVKFHFCQVYRIGKHMETDSS